jgi:hypothetical protein
MSPATSGSQLPQPEVMAARTATQSEGSPDASGPLIYQIRLKGHLEGEWDDWFDGLTVTLEDKGETVLCGGVTDQAALHGLLKKVRDLGMPLVSLQQVEPDAEAPEAQQ